MSRSSFFKVVCETLLQNNTNGSDCRLVQLAANNYVPPKLLEPMEGDTIPLVTPDSAVASIFSVADQYDCPDCAPRQFDGFPGVSYVNQQNMLGLYRVLAHPVRCIKFPHQLCFCVDRILWLDS
jgi:hypothetical protein